MSVITDKLAKIEESVDKAVARVQEDVVGLAAKVDALQKKIDDGTATAEDIQVFERINAKLDALDPVKPDVLPEPEPPAPEPAA